MYSNDTAIAKKLSISISDTDQFVSTAHVYSGWWLCGITIRETTILHSGPLTNHIISESYTRLTTAWQPTVIMLYSKKCQSLHTLNSA